MTITVWCYLALIILIVGVIVSCLVLAYRERYYTLRTLSQMRVHHNLQHDLRSPASSVFFSVAVPGILLVLGGTADISVFFPVAPFPTGYALVIIIGAIAGGLTFLICGGILLLDLLSRVGTFVAAREVYLKSQIIQLLPTVERSSKKAS